MNQISEVTSKTSKGQPRAPTPIKKKYLAEGYCDEHDTYKGLGCIDCNEWICGMCATLNHKFHTTITVEKAYKERKFDVSQRIKEELRDRKAKAREISKSLKLLNIKRKELFGELKYCEIKIKKLKSQKIEEQKLLKDLKQIHLAVETGVGVEIAAAEKDFEILLEKAKHQILDLQTETPLTIESLDTLCMEESVYAVEDQNDAPIYGKVKVKNGRIWISHFHFQPVLPYAKFIPFEKLLSMFNGSKLPTTAFLKMTRIGEEEPDEDDDNISDDDESDANEDEVVIEARELNKNRRAKNFILLCAAIKGPSYIGFHLKWKCFPNSVCEMSPAPPTVVEKKISNSNRGTPLRKGGVYELGKHFSSSFRIPLEDDPLKSSRKFGAVIAGLENLKTLRSECIITDSGVII